jgi:hypothetical protein
MLQNPQLERRRGKQKRHGICWIGAILSGFQRLEGRARGARDVAYGEGETPPWRVESR